MNVWISALSFSLFNLGDDCNSGRLLSCSQTNVVFGTTCDISLKVRLWRCWNPLFAKVRTHQRTGMFSGSRLHHHEPFISSASAVPCSKLWNEPYEWESVEWIQCVNLILGHLKRQDGSRKCEGNAKWNHINHQVRWSSLIIDACES